MTSHSTPPIYIVFGGSAGLGLQSTLELLERQKHVVIFSRSVSPDLLQKKNIEHIKLDLTSDNSQLFSDFLRHTTHIGGVCFSQRHRISTEVSYTTLNSHLITLAEFSTSVVSTGLFLQLLLEQLKDGSIDTSPLSHCPIVIVGSTYADSVGFDQPWQYHAAKAAQQSLVKYYSFHGARHLAINSLHPPSFIKQSSNTHSPSFEDKIRRWSQLPARSLDSVVEIANICVDFLLDPREIISGNQIRLDHGTGYLYPDQTPTWS